MLNRILGSRALMSATVALVVIAAGAIALTAGNESPPTRAYCADMPDSIGLYEGSAVTVLGVRVGEVTGIDLAGTVARVRFTVRADRTLPLDVGAVTVSDTLLADRTLTLVGDEPAGAGWNPGECITKTLTPKSLSETFDALAHLADQLEGAGDPAEQAALGAGLTALDRATSGTGDQLNAIINQLGTALAAPDAAIGHIGALLDALGELTRRARAGWSQVRETITGLPQAFNDINLIAFPPIIDLVDGLSKTLPQINDVIVMFASPALRALDSVENLAGLIASGVGSLRELIAMVPAIAGGFGSAKDPATGQTRIGYAGPSIALAQQDTVAVCAGVQAITGQQCRTNPNGAITVPLLPALLSAVSAR
ncbi:MlaD family protein [Nocardia sp. NPDC005978]|uniref:MlaD family protein n=1 Tax=Nocardia sp. NPDC005978 TaxID=3156725 RepID=UPI0033BF5D08